MKSRLLLLVLCFPLYTLSQNIHLLSSEEAVRIALENNLDIKIVKADQEIAIINNNWGNAGKWPTVVGALGNTFAVTNLNQELSNGSEIKRSGVTNNISSASLAANWRIYNGKKIRATKKRFEELEKIGDIDVEQQMQSISFNVLVSYYNIVRLNQQVKTTNAIIALFTERLKIAETRFNVGSAAKTDMLQAQIDLNEQEINLTDIFRQKANFLAILNTLLLQPADYAFEVVDTTFKLPRINYTASLAKVDTQNLNLLRAERERALLVQDRVVINSQRLPVLSLNSVTNFNRNKATAGLFLINQTYGPNIGINLGIPIYNSNIYNTQLKVNAVQQKQQQLQIDLIRIQVQRDMLIAYQEYQTAIVLAEVERRNVKSAEENNYIATERFKKLQGNTIELRQAQLSLIEAQDRLINAEFRAKLAATAIQLIIGEVGSE